MQGVHKALGARLGLSRDLKHVEFAGVFKCLPPVAEPDPDHFAVVIELLGDFRDLLACGQGVLLEVGVEGFDGLWRERGAPLALLGGLAPHKFHQVLLAFLVPQLGLAQPFFQHGLQLLGALGSDVQLLKPVKSAGPPG